MIICWVFLEKNSNVIFYLTAGIYITVKYQKYFLRYVLMYVPPRIWWVYALWHCNVASWWVKFLSVRTVCEELMVFDRVSSMGLLFSVQKTLPGTHEVWHTTSVSDPYLMYWSLGTTLQVFACWPAGTKSWNRVKGLVSLSRSNTCHQALHSVITLNKDISTSATVSVKQREIHQRMRYCSLNGAN